MATFHGQAPADVQDEQLLQSWRTALNFDDEPAAGAQPPLSEAEAETCRALAKKGCEPAAIATMVNADEASVRSARRPLASQSRACRALGKSLLELPAR